MITRVRQWIDAKDHRPAVAAVGIVQIPVVAGCWITAAAVGAPWWVMPAALGVALLIIGWILLVVAALGTGR